MDTIYDAARDRLSSKERVRRAFSHQEPDRVPVDYVSNPGVDARLKQQLGLQAEDHEGLLRALGVDFRNCWPSYSGAPLHGAAPGIVIDHWGTRRRWIEHSSGGYWDYCEWPLAGAD